MRGIVPRANFGGFDWASLLGLAKAAAMGHR